MLGLYNNIALFFSFENILKNEEEVTCIVEIIGLKEEKNYTSKYTFKIINCEEIPESKNKKFIGYVEKEKNYKAGDIVLLKGIMQRAEESRNFYGFNQRNNLKQNKIYGIMQVETSEYIKTKQDIYFILGKIQASLKQKVEKLYDENYENTINKILFGMSGNIGEEIISDFRDAGISHVLAISGLHISYVVVMINFILEKIIHNIKIRNRCICIILIVFLIITGASPSCIRACIMNILYLVSKNLYRKSNIYISIGFSFIVLIFFNMYVVYNIGMWLSFLGTLGIVLFHDLLRKILKLKKDIFIHKIIDIILVSLSAQILLWPIVLYCFNTIFLTFFISNIFISIIIGPIILLGYFSVIVSYFVFPIAECIVMFEEILVKILYLIADICSKIPFSKIYIKWTNEWVLLIYYSFICFILYCYYKNRIGVIRIICSIKNIMVKKKFLYRLKKNLKNLKKIKILKCRQILIVISFIIVFIIIVYIKNQDFKLYFVDVGQGDCSVIQVDGKNIIIDSGEGNSESYDYGKNVVFQHLLKLGINKLDYVIFSHMDSDHAGGLMYILENMEVGEVLISIQSEGSYQLDTLLKIIKKKNVKLTILEANMQVKISSNCFIEILWPVQKELIEENALNNNSLVFKLYYNEFSMLFTGDIEQIAEKQIAEKYKEKLKCDILKIAHHGSKTSSIKEFLRYAKPNIVLIGVGKNNKFSHPSEITIQNLNKINCKIYRTDLHGEILLKIKKNKIFVKTKLK